MKDYHKSVGNDKVNALLKELGSDGKESNLVAQLERINI